LHHNIFHLLCIASISKITSLILALAVSAAIVDPFPAQISLNLSELWQPYGGTVRPAPIQHLILDN